MDVAGSSGEEVDHPNNSTFVIDEADRQYALPVIHIEQ